MVESMFQIRITIGFRYLTETVHISNLLVRRALEMLNFKPRGFDDFYRKRAFRRRPLQPPHSGIRSKRHFSTKVGHTGKPGWAAS